MTNTNAYIRPILDSVRHMSLATIDEQGRPWSTELDYVAADDLTTLYFRSPAHRRHCVNIAADQRVSGAINRQHEVGAPVEGVTFLGRAALLGMTDNEQEILTASGLFVARLQANPSIVDRARDPAGPQFYAVDIETWHYYGAPDGGKPQTYTLPMHREATGGA